MRHESEDDTIVQLQNILHIAHDLREATIIIASHQHPPSSSPSATDDCSAMLDSIDLPVPQTLVPSLLEAGATHKIATAANKMYQIRAEELRQHIQACIIAVWRKMVELPRPASVPSCDPLIRKVVSTATRVYLCRLDQWKADVVQRVKQRSAATIKVAAKNIRVFNQEYVPLLEQFFEEHPFPSHADKLLLAKKSNMEYKQIHVWFQNRRNRTNKDKTLRKKARESARKPWDTPYLCTNGHLVNPDSRAPKSFEVCLSEGTAESDVSNDIFASYSPPHAFPSSYPPTCHYDPFPCKNGPVRFSKPQWRRTPDGKRPSPISTDIDDLVEKFSHLNVRNGTRTKGTPKLQSNAATVAITVIPSRAPHPSLIVRKYFEPTNMVQPYPSVRAPVTYPKVFSSPSPTSKPVTLMPLSTPPSRSMVPGKRKITSLPQRLPGRTRNASRDSTPSESSTASSPRLFSTDSENRSCSFSSVSSLSTPSDTAGVRDLL